MLCDLEQITHTLKFCFPGCEIEVERKGVEAAGLSPWGFPAVPFNAIHSIIVITYYVPDLPLGAGHPCMNREDKTGGLFHGAYSPVEEGKIHQMTTSKLQQM